MNPVIPGGNQPDSGAIANDVNPVGSDVDTMALSEMVHAIWRAFTVALLVAVTVGGFTYVLSSLLPERFEASATLLVTESNNALTSMGLSLAAAPAIDADAYVALAISTPVLAMAAQQVGGPDVLDRYSVAASSLAMEVSSFVHVKVRGPGASGTTEMANAVASSLVEWDNQRTQANVADIQHALEQQVTLLQNQLKAARDDSSMTPAQIETLSALLTTRIHDLTVTESLETSAVAPIKVVEPAIVPAAPYAPRPTLYGALAAVVAFLMGFGLTLFRRAMDTRVQSSRELERITNLVVLGTVPSGAKGAPAVTVGMDYVLANLSLDDENFPYAFTLTSSSRAPALARAATYLAIALAREGRQTLLVDADLFLPQLSRRFRIAKNTPPFLAYLQDPDRRFDPARVAIDSAVAIDFVPGVQGQAGRTGLLSRNFASLVESWRGLYDAVVFVLPPITDSADPIAFAPHTDGVILVAALGAEDARCIRDAVTRLTRRGIRPLGLVAVQSRPDRAVRSPKRAPKSKFSAPKPTQH